MRLLVLGCGIVIGFTSLSIARGSVPFHQRVTDDTALYQKLSEIQVPRQGRPDFDKDIAELARLEDRYQEKLPSLADNPRLAGPIQRISQQKYRYSGAAKHSGAAKRPVRQ